MAHAIARRRKEWNSINAFGVDLAADGTSLVAGLSVAAAVTVMRMIGEYSISTDGAPTALDEATIIVGIGVISTDAFAAGGGSTPDPGGEAEYPWLYWASHKLYFPTGTDGYTGDCGNFRRSFDIRSMRKMKPRETLAFIMEYSDMVGTPALRFTAGATRVLIGV